MGDYLRNHDHLLTFFWSFALPGHPVAMMLFKTWGYIVSKIHCPFVYPPYPSLLRLWFKHWHLRPILNSVIIWKVCHIATSTWFSSLTFFFPSCSQGYVLESGTSSNVLFLSLIQVDVEAKLDCSHCCRWNSTARCSSMDVHQYYVMQSFVYLLKHFWHLQ